MERVKRKKHERVSSEISTDFSVIFHHAMTTCIGEISYSKIAKDIEISRNRNLEALISGIKLPGN